MRFIVAVPVRECGCGQMLAGASFDSSTRLALLFNIVTIEFMQYCIAGNFGEVFNLANW